VTVDVLPSQLGRSVPEIRAWGQCSKVDQMLLRAASVKSRWARCYGSGPFLPGPYTLSRVG
jgi:hypothetical protein